jgi:hypothetical protein
MRARPYDHFLHFSDTAGAATLRRLYDLDPWDTLQRLGNVLLRKLAGSSRRDGIGDDSSAAISMEACIFARCPRRRWRPVPVLLQASS